MLSLNKELRIMPILNKRKSKFLDLLRYTNNCPNWQDKSITGYHTLFLNQFNCFH